jgi:hypothetical protein
VDPGVQVSVHRLVDQHGSGHSLYLDHLGALERADARLDNELRL